MKKVFLVFIVMTFALFTAPQLNAQCGSHQKSHAKQVSNKQHWSSSDIVDIAAGADQFSTLVAAVKAANLVETLKSDGPFTVFAPTNAAFSKIPAATLESLLQPANKSALSQVLTYHVLPFKLTAAEAMGAIKASNGKAILETVSGGKLIATISGNNIILQDEKGNYSAITDTDINASNGVIHTIDTVVMPK